MTIDKNIKEIRMNKIFSDLSDSEIDSLINPDNLLHINEGDVIYQTGDDTNELYLLLRGNVKIKFPSHNYISNKIFNDFFGEKELFENTRRNSSAVAINNCLLYLLKKNDLESFLAKSPAINKNIETLGELKIPKIPIKSIAKFDIANSIKPRSFRASVTHKENFPEPKKESENKNVNDMKMEMISQFINEEIHNEELDSINAADAGIEEIENNNLHFTLPDISEIKEETAAVIEEKEKEVPEPENKTEHINFQSLFDSISVIHTQLTIYDTTNSIIKTFRELTFSEAGEIYRINEIAGEMRKFVSYNEIIKEIQYKSSEGLTGTCALQRKVLNFENPGEDSRFVEEIDQPGNTALKKIVFLPLINEQDEILAVLQLARKNKNYSDEEIKRLKLITKQAAIAIERGKKYEQLIEKEKQQTNDYIAKFLTENILIPIYIINRYASLLNRGEFSQKVKSIISLLEKQANLFWDIIQSTFDYNKVDFALSIEKVSINSYLDGIIELLSEYCNSRNVNLFKKTGDDANVNIDPGKLFMAIYQIIKNGCDVTKANGKLFISTDKMEGYLQINVKDSGKGIPDEDKDQIFITSYSESKGRNKLGLAITKKIIDLHGGQITFSSKINKGSTFSIHIPIITDAE